VNTKDPLRLFRPQLTELGPAAERQAVGALVRLLAAEGLTPGAGGGPMGDPAAQEDAA
jgi:hypothetical protein